MELGGGSDETTVTFLLYDQRTGNSLHWLFDYPLPDVGVNCALLRNTFPPSTLPPPLPFLVVTGV
jgi:hypothetical protein